MTGNDRRYLQVMRAMLVLLMDELRDMEVGDDEDEGEREEQVEAGEDLYEFKKPAEVPPIRFAETNDRR